MFQSFLRVLRSRAKAYSLLFSAPIVYRTSPTIARPPKPAPPWSKVHSSVGPPLGQVFSRPVSFETSVRSGPRHAGQSAANVVPARAHSAASTGSVDLFIASNLSLVGTASRECEGGGSAGMGPRAGCGAAVVQRGAV